MTDQSKERDLNQSVSNAGHPTIQHHPHARDEVVDLVGDVVARHLVQVGEHRDREDADARELERGVELVDEACAIGRETKGLGGGREAGSLAARGLRQVGRLENAARLPCSASGTNRNLIGRSLRYTPVCRHSTWPPT